MNTLLSIGKQIRQVRLSAQLTTAELAQACSIARSTLVRLESGQGNIELNTLFAICNQLGLTVQLIPSEVAMMPTPDQTTASPLAQRLSMRLNRLQPVLNKSAK